MPINELINMGGYGVYVWSAYAITLSVFGIIFIATLRERKQVNKKVQHYLKRQANES